MLNFFIFVFRSEVLHCRVEKVFYSSVSTDTTDSVKNDPTKINSTDLSRNEETLRCPGSPVGGASLCSKAVSSLQWPQVQIHFVGLFSCNSLFLSPISCPVPQLSIKKAQKLKNSKKL